MLHIVSAMFARFGHQYEGSPYKEEWRFLGCFAVLISLRTDVSEELSTSIIKVIGIVELGTTLAISSGKVLRNVGYYKIHTA
jgi:hypothetical protein